MSRFRFFTATTAALALGFALLGAAAPAKAEKLTVMLDLLPVRRQRRNALVREMSRERKEGYPSLRRHDPDQVRRVLEQRQLDLSRMRPAPLGKCASQLAADGGERQAIPWAAGRRGGGVGQPPGSAPETHSNELAPQLLH